MAHDSSAVLPASHEFPLPPSAVHGAQTRDFGVYVHVPFCQPDCGYCDGATTTSGAQTGVMKTRHHRLIERELASAREALAAAGVGPRAARSVFFGGGTPTVLPSRDIGYMLGAIARGDGITDDAEITVETHPDTVDPTYLTALRNIGVTRISLRMYSAVPRVLHSLGRPHERTHVWDAASTARELGLHVALDLVFGTPGETAEDWQKTLDIALAMEPDHVSAYAAVAEPGTALTAAIERGESDDVDPDTQANFYLMADQVLADADFEWYELNHWARTPEHRSRHQIGYWRSADWLGVGPGAHSHVGGVRWWNVPSLGEWGERVERGASPVQSHEVLDGSAQQLEKIMLGLKTRDGLALDSLAGAQNLVEQWSERGLLDEHSRAEGRLVLSASGRLLADALITELVSVQEVTQQAS